MSLLYSSEPACFPVCCYNNQTAVELGVQATGAGSRGIRCTTTKYTEGFLIIDRAVYIFCFYSFLPLKGKLEATADALEGKRQGPQSPVTVVETGVPGDSDGVFAKTGTGSGASAEEDDRAVGLVSRVLPWVGGLGGGGVTRDNASRSLYLHPNNARLFSTAKRYSTRTIQLLLP